TMTSHIGAGISGQNFDFSSGFLSQTLSYPVANDAAAWTEGVNYTRLTITLEEGEALNVAVSAAGAQSRGFLNAAAIVPVPEPTAALSAIGGLCVLIGFRRARRS